MSAIPSRKGWNPLPLLGLLVVAVAAVALLLMAGQQQEDSRDQSSDAAREGSKHEVPEWMEGPEVQMPEWYEWLPISKHAEKHPGRVWGWESLSEEIREFFLEGHCAAVRAYCKGSQELWLCFDATSGKVGGLFVFPDVPWVRSGWVMSQEKWYKFVTKPEAGWSLCK